MDLVCLQEGFSSLIKNADPQQLGPFFVWLDFKVAQFKINGTFSPEKTNKTALEKVTKNLFESESITTTATTSTIMFPGTSNLESQNAAPTYMSTPIRDNKAYISHLSKSLSFSESKLSMYQLNWEALNPRLGFRNNLNPTLPLRGSLFPQLLPEILSEPLDFSKTDKRNSQHHGIASGEEYNPAATEAGQNNFKPKEGIRSLLREVLSRPREMPLCSTPIKTPPQVKEEKTPDAPSDVLVVLPEEPNQPSNESRQETRHVCTICQKEFNYKSSYRRHMKIHQGLYSHTCCICTRKFTRKEHFVRHKCDRRPNKPNRRSAVLDISMNSEPDSSSLVRMDELDADSPIKADRSKLGSPRSGNQKVDSSVRHGRQPFPEYAAVGDSQHREERHEHSSQRNSPHNYHEDDLNKNLESRRKSSTPRKFVPHSSEGGASDVEENGSSQVPKSENDSRDTIRAKNTTGRRDASSARGARTPLEIGQTGERHLDLQTGSYVVSTSLVKDREEALAIKIKKQAKYLKLKNEAKMVDGTLRFECPQCSKVFFRSSNFSRHMRIHRGIYSYVCQACKRGFFRKEHFQKHKCHRRGQDTHLDAMNGRSLMPSTTDARGLPFFGSDLGNGDARKTSSEDARTSPYLSLYKPEDSNNLIRCLQ